jgi:hypothetical protein
MYGPKAVPFNDRRKRCALTRGIPGLKRETWGTHRFLPVCSPSVLTLVCAEASTLQKVSSNAAFKAPHRCERLYGPTKVVP